MSEFRLLDERTIHRGHVIHLVDARFATPDGGAIHREIVRHPGAVAVVPATADGHVVLVRQYRVALGTEILEIPAGKRDIVEEPADRTAHRELAEEVGLAADRLDLLTELVPTPGFCDEKMVIFLATGLHDVATSPQGAEERHMTIERLHLDHAVAEVMGSAVPDAKTLVGLLLTRERLRGS